MKFDIIPVWGTMDHLDFTDQVERLFGDLNSILDFCGLKVGKVSKYKAQFWPLWKAWKRLCLEKHGDYGRLIRKINLLTLPGEPTDH